jgi:hypothetical protein
MGMTLEKLASWRIERLQAFVDLKFEGNKAALGRALGYKDGAFVGQMLRGARPITEKTVEQVQGLLVGRGWFAGDGAKAVVVATMANEERASFNVVTLESAVARIAQHLVEVDTYNPATAISLFSILANDPTMHEIVVAGLKSLKPEARAPAKQSTPAQETSRPKAA